MLGVADVDHELDARLDGGALGHPGHFDSHDFEGGGDHAGLDAPDDALVGLDGGDGLVQIDAGGAEDVGGGGQSGAADVEEGEDLGVVVGDDVVGEASKGVAAGASGVDHGGDAGADAAEIGLDAVAVDAVVDMGVEVDEAGSDDLALDFDDAPGLGGGNVGGDQGDFSVLDGDVAGAVEALGRVDYGAALNYQIVHEAQPPVQSGWGGF